MTDIFSVYNQPALILFDSGASHSFISQNHIVKTTLLVLGLENWSVSMQIIEEAIARIWAILILGDVHYHPGKANVMQIEVIPSGSLSHISVEKWEVLYTSRIGDRARSIVPRNEVTMNVMIKASGSFQKKIQISNIEKYDFTYVTENLGKIKRPLVQITLFELKINYWSYKTIPKMNIKNPAFSK
ncbi:hypothetical protein ACJX0J_037840 [Zea mays]